MSPCQVCFLRNVCEELKAEQDRVLSNKFKDFYVLGPNVYLSGVSKRVAFSVLVNRKYEHMLTRSLYTPCGSAPDIDTDSRNTRERLLAGTVLHLPLRTRELVCRRAGVLRQY